MTERSTSLRRPRRLRPGDRVAVVAPGGVVASERLNAGVDILRGWGLDVHIGPHVLDRHPHLPYLAGTDADRAADLRSAWCDPAFAGVFCARGGYGCRRTLDALSPSDWSAMAAAEPPVLVGASDVTAIHTAFAARFDVGTVHGPMVAATAFTGDPTPAEGLRRTLFEPDAATVLRGPGAGPLIPGRARGRTVGGNLSLLAADAGAPDLPLPEAGAIGLLEDVNEPAYRIDRALTQLARAGWLARLSGIALGSWVDCGDPDTLRSVLLDRLAPLGVPVLHDLGFGHGPIQTTVPLGVVADLDADAGTLTLLEPALR